MLRNWKREKIKNVVRANLGSGAGDKYKDRTPNSFTVKTHIYLGANTHTNYKLQNTKLQDLEPNPNKNLACLKVAFD